MIPKWLDILLNPFQLYTIPLDDWVTAAVNFIVDNFRPLFETIRFYVNSVLSQVEWVLVNTPPLILLAGLGLSVWQLVGRRVAIFTVVSLSMIGFLGVWEQAMITLALMVVAVLICIVIGIPLGIACAKSDRLERLLQPMLDTMQTLPTFIYLIPVVMLFGIGQIAGVIAVTVVAVPPLIRLTNLGIRQVPEEVSEAALAFGSTPIQLLWEVQLPLAIPSILLGLNQTILAALSMEVIAAMIGVEGLGVTVLRGLANLNIGQAAVGSVGIVLLAVVLDRITQGIGKAERQLSQMEQRPIGLLRAWRTRRKSSVA